MSYESIEEQLYCEASDALTTAVDSILKDMYKAHGITVGDISPLDDERVDDLRMALASAIADVVKKNISMAEALRIMKPSDDVNRYL